MAKRIIALNPTAKYTAVAVYDGLTKVAGEELRHSPEELAAYEGVWDQFRLRKERLDGFFAREGIDLSQVDAFVGRGGLLRPLASGVYQVNGAMLTDLRRGVQGEHAANLGGALAYNFAHPLRRPAYVVDPVSVDEMEPLARYSGLPELPRTSLVHALSLKQAARRAAAELGRAYTDINLITVYLGMGISVVPHRQGRMVDVNNPVQEGPFSPERAGTVPVGEVVRLCFSGRYSERELVQKLTGQSGLAGYLGTSDIREVERRVEQGDPVSRLVYEAMAYQIAKEIGAMATVLRGQAEALVLTGPLAESPQLVDWIRQRAAFVAPLLVYPGSDELGALAEGALRALTGQEPVLSYDPAPKEAVR